MNAGLPQGILELSLFLTYIKDLRNGLQSNPKPYAGNTSLFSTVQDITLSTVNLCIKQKYWSNKKATTNHTECSLFNNL